MLDLIREGVFDYLFLLETWYVDHAARRGDPRVIATTEMPPTPLLTGRHPGGITLLGTPAAQAGCEGLPSYTARKPSLSPPAMAVSQVSTSHPA